MPLDHDTPPPPAPREPPGTEPSTNTTDLAISRLFAHQDTLVLETVDLAFLVSITAEVRSRGGDTRLLDRETLRSLFTRVQRLGGLQDTTRSDADMERCVASLTRARCLFAMDKTAFRKEARTYNLTKMGDDIAALYQNDQPFSADTFAGLLQAFLYSLSSYSERAHQSTRADWVHEALPGLHRTTDSLLESMNRNLNQLDAQYEHATGVIRHLLADRSEEAIRQCQDHLETVHKVLNDLRQTASSRASQAARYIREIDHARAQWDATETGRVCDHIADQIGHIRAWIALRSDKWREFHGRIHNYLQEHVNLDRGRRFTERLSQAVTQSAPLWRLRVMDQPPLWMRAPQDREHPQEGVKKRVSGPRRDRGAPRSEEASPARDLDALVARLHARLEATVAVRGVAWSETAQWARDEGMDEKDLILVLAKTYTKVVQAGGARLDLKARPVIQVSATLALHDLLVRPPS